VVVLLDGGEQPVQEQPVEAAELARVVGERPLLRVAVEPVEAEPWRPTRHQKILT
jgi:hypothetical protein